MRNGLLLLLAVLTAFVSIGQNVIPRPNEKSVVQDSDGTVYPYAVWHNLMLSGDYKIKAEDPKNPQTAFRLEKRSEKEKNELINRLAKPKESTFFQNGEQIGLFKTKDIHGNKIDLKSIKDKIVVLNFWFINCSPCRREIPQLNEMVEQYKGNDSVMFVAVALDDRYSIELFLKSTPFFYSIVDDGRYIAEKYGIKSYPTHVILDTEGKVYFHTTGLALNTVHWLKKSINELLEKNTNHPLSEGK